MRDIGHSFQVEANTEAKAVEIAKQRYIDRVTVAEVKKVEPITPPTAADKRVHLVKCGDSLFGAETWECGDAKEKGGIGYFPDYDTIHRVTCRKCMASQTYRDVLKEMGEEHPFTKAAKKAHATMKARGVKQAKD